jgi:hypothetical protein
MLFNTEIHRLRESQLYFALKAEFNQGVVNLRHFQFYTLMTKPKNTGSLLGKRTHTEVQNSSQREQLASTTGNTA